MPQTVAAAFPFIEVFIDTSALQPTAQRSPGVIAVVGASNAGDAAADVPTPCETIADAAAHFGTGTPLFRALSLALLQDPKPTSIYGVKTGGSSVRLRRFLAKRKSHTPMRPAGIATSIQWIGKPWCSKLGATSHRMST